jgi:hypothetical protein
MARWRSASGAISVSHISELDDIPGKSTSGGPSGGPLSRTKVSPKRVLTVRVRDGTGQRAARAS